MRLNRSGYRLVVDERFDGEQLDSTRWIDHYLPQWSTPDRTRARYSTGADGLALRIDHDQPPWSPEFDGDVRVSSLQTGVHSGPVGSAVGQHRFRDGLIVRTAQPSTSLWMLSTGVIDVTVRPSPHPRALTALWLIGAEVDPRESGEVCVVELFGREIADPANARIGVGIHPFQDDRLFDDHALVSVAGDLRASHTYSAELLVDRTRFFVDDELVAESAQQPAYPLQIMLNLYELPDESPRLASEFPLEAHVTSIREWHPR